MIINTNILKRFIDVPTNLVELTNSYIIEVDRFEAINQTTNVITGKVLTCEDHPNSDHLHITTVDINSEILQIVCGASNVAAGQYVIVAKVGAILPGNFEIKSATIRGVASSGMICSLRELGFEDKYLDEANLKGIFSFNKEVPLGVAALNLLGQEGFLLELGLTPNRADLLSHYGFAQDLAAVLNTKIKQPQIEVSEASKVNEVSVKIDSNGCGRYYARVIDVVIKDSPWWLKSALISAGIRPINNVVDITNYVLLEYGTPLHAFDAKKVKTNQIVVKEAVGGQKVISLDDETRVLEAGDVVVTNGKEPIAIAGVMGLKNTMVSDDTTSIILEAAYFDPKKVSQTSKRLGLRSESSLRFERGIDDRLVIVGLNRACQLLIELADAKVYQNINSAINYENENPKVFVGKNYVNKLLGRKFTIANLEESFKRLNYGFDAILDGYLLQGPSYRNDLVIAADFVEEIGRIYGFNNIINKPLVTGLIGGLTNSQKLKRQIRHSLANQGLNEVITYSLTSEAKVDSFSKFGETVAILKPLGEDRKYLRQSLVSGLLDVASYNSNRGNTNLALFEIGSVFAKDIEKTHLAVLLSGKWIATTWLNCDVNSDIFLLKGITQQVFSTTGSNLTFNNKPFDFLHPGISGEVLSNNQVIGSIGKLHPSLASKHNLADTYLIEVDLTTILRQDSPKVEFSPLSKYPTVSRDLSFVVEKSYPVNQIIELIYQTGRKLIVNVEIFDVYKGDNVAAGYHSLAVRITFNDANKTLESNDVDKLIRSIKNRLEFNFKAQIRD